MTTAEQAASSAATQYAVRTERAATAAVSSGERAATAAVSSHQCYITASAAAPPVLRWKLAHTAQGLQLAGVDVCVCVWHLCVWRVCEREEGGLYIGYRLC